MKDELYEGRILEMHAGDLRDAIRKVFPDEQANDKTIEVLREVFAKTSVRSFGPEAQQKVLNALALDKMQPIAR